MHDSQKKVLFHSDSDLGSLAPLMLEAGFDGADCLATQPLVKETIEDYLKVWDGRIVCWGGLPSMIFDTSYPRREYEQAVRSLVKLTKGRSDFIFGASDHVMPGAPWERPMECTLRGTSMTK